MLVAQALEINSCGGVGVCFFLSFFGFLGHLFSLVLALFFLQIFLRWTSVLKDLVCVFSSLWLWLFLFVWLWRFKERTFLLVWICLGFECVSAHGCEVFLPRNWVGSREKILGFVMATQNLATQSLYESASHPQRDVSTFLEYNPQGDVYDYPEFTELSQRTHPLVWNNHIGSGNMNFWRELSLWPGIQN